ncbi:disulfide bond formation protein B [Polaromonas sp.]|nr:disulfide bond formation protein B [Polaromonas sp.]
MLLSLLDAPRRLLAVVALSCLGSLVFGLYLQHIVGLDPCPMCIVQRYVMVLVTIVAALSAALGKHKPVLLGGNALMVLLAGFGAFVAARQTLLQWYPPEIASCGRDFYGMIETFPLKRAIPMIFKGSGDCSAVDWTFLGGSIANWSFLCFVLIVMAGIGMMVRSMRKPLTA